MRTRSKPFCALGGDRPCSTIVATGTGSGKTECFLYPILHHCRRHAGEPGIKAILIYPMNALASDQAERPAALIRQNPCLKGKVTAGLFVGGSEQDPERVMGPNHIITHKDILRLRPPDILLTNYKMLDHLLIRPKDFPLWQQNRPETLRFLVVDELHTFDGAQGTDLACLLRRLKARLKTPPEFLCCIGTSATLGSDRERDDLRGYAEAVFGEPFDADSVVTESRLSANEFLGETPIVWMAPVTAPEHGALRPESYGTYPEYVTTQYRLWFGGEIPLDRFADVAWRVELGERLKEHSFFQSLLRVLDGRIRDYGETLEELARS